MSSDRLRAVVGAGERDQRASRDAFELLDLIVGKRLRRGLTTVVDTTGLEPKRRAAWRALAEQAGVPAYAVVLDTPEKVVRERNRARGTPVPAKVVAAQLREAASVAEALAGEGFAGVHAPARSSWCRPRSWTRRRRRRASGRIRCALEFGLQMSRFGWDGHRRPRRRRWPRSRARPRRPGSRASG